MAKGGKHITVGGQQPTEPRETFCSGLLYLTHSMRLGLSCRLLSLVVLVSADGLEQVVRSPSSAGPSHSRRILQYYSPRDIVHDSIVRFALEALSHADDDDDKDDALLFLARTAVEDAGMGTRECFCMTIMGSKTGYYTSTSPSIEAEMNQDRAFVAMVTTTTTRAAIKNIDADDADPPASPDMTVVAVLDGHGDKGHYVSEMGKQRLVDRMQVFLLAAANATLSEDDLTAFWVNALQEIDASIPSSIGRAGGATVSMGLFYNHTFIAMNAGDSQTVLGAVYKHSSDQHQILQLFETRLDKPDDPDERARVTKDHPTARIQGETSSDVARVWFPNGYGLAMTRAIGDFEADAVIATPTVTIISFDDMVQLAKELLQAQSESCEVAAASGESDCSTVIKDFDATKLEFFMYSATDGVLDYMGTPELTRRVGQAFVGGSQHPFVGVRDILLNCKDRWKHDSPRYRDDMAMAVAKLQTVL